MFPRNILPPSPRLIILLYPALSHIRLQPWGSSSIIILSNLVQRLSYISIKGKSLTELAWNTLVAVRVFRSVMRNLPQYKNKVLERKGPSNAYIWVDTTKTLSTFKTKSENVKWQCLLWQKHVSTISSVGWKTYSTFSRLISFELCKLHNVYSLNCSFQRMALVTMFKNNLLYPVMGLCNKASEV
jgi:hypothetical protein